VSPTSTAAAGIHPPAFVDWMASDGLALDLKGDKYLDRLAHFAHIQDVMESFFLYQTGDEAYHGGQSRGLAIGVISTPEDVVGDERLQACRFFVDVNHHDIPAAAYPGVPFRFSAFGSAPARRAPNLGEHTHQLIDTSKEPAV
jgi:crotonobetainyl-CoA:carnitine CoA-transferase CaiB-like acyl-CoA transferase